MQLIYDHQQQEHIRLLNELESVPTHFHKLPFHSWIHHNTPVHALSKQAHEMIWHQRLIHLSPQTIKEAYNYVDGIPDLSCFNFDDVTKCPTSIKANLRKNSPTKRSLSEMVTCPYQGLFIDFGFLGCVLHDKEGKVITSSHENIKGLKGKKSLDSDQ